MRKRTTAKVTTSRSTLVHVSIVVIASFLSFFISKFFGEWEKYTEGAHKASTFLRSHEYIAHIVVTLFLISLLEMLYRLWSHRNYSKMAQGANMFFYIANEGTKQVSKGYAFLKEIAHDCHNVQIQCATGWETFGEPNSPLHDALEHCSEAYILLIDPSSHSVISRAKDIGMTAGAYQEEIYKSILHLKELRERGRLIPKLQLKMYQSYPFWKFINVDEYVWVQHYPEHEHVKNSPCFAFRWKTNSPGLYLPFIEQFYLKWNSHRFGKYDFETGFLSYFDDKGKFLRSKQISDEQTTLRLIQK